MSGHSKWANIKHRKAAQDAKKANIFTKLAKDISIAAKSGGDPDMNFQLRLAIDKARSLNMPNDKIDRAIKRGTGQDKDQSQLEELILEAYGPGQIAMLITVATDNKNRAISEVKNILNKNGAKSVSAGSISWQFQESGSLSADRGELTDEEMEIAIIDSGARDYSETSGNYVIYTNPRELKNVKEFLEKSGIIIREASLVYLAKNSKKIDENTKIDYEKLLSALDENDDVAEVFDDVE